MSPNARWKGRVTPLLKPFIAAVTTLLPSRARTRENSVLTEDDLVSAKTKSTVMSRIKSGANLFLRSVAFAFFLVLTATFISAVLLCATGEEGMTARVAAESLEHVITSSTRSSGTNAMIVSSYLAILSVALPRYSLALGFLIFVFGVSITGRTLNPPIDDCFRCMVVDLDRGCGPPRRYNTERVWDYWVNGESVCGW